MESSAGKELPDVKNFEKEMLMAQEKELLGVYITGHPLREYEEDIKRTVTVNAQDLAEVLDSEERGEEHSFIKDGMQAVMAGIVTSKRLSLPRTIK